MQFSHFVNMYGRNLVMSCETLTDDLYKVYTSSEHLLKIGMFLIYGKNRFKETDLSKVNSG